MEDDTGNGKMVICISRRRRSVSLAQDIFMLVS